MSSSNENNTSFENQKKPVQANYFEEIDLISSNPKLSNTIDTSGNTDAILNDKITKKYQKLSINSSTNTSSSSQDLVYGVSIEIKKPRKLGSVKAFIYINNFPLIVIGPNCKLFTFIFLYKIYIVFLF